jgi:hypothetical protein
LKALDNLEEAAKKAFEAIFNDYKMMEWEGKQRAIKHSARGLKFLVIDRYTFIEENPKKNSIWGKLTRDGHKILWIIEDGDSVGQVRDGVYRDFNKD